MTKRYAVLNSNWGEQILVPLELVPSIIESSYVVTTSYENSRTVIQKAKPITSLELYTEDDLNCALAQTALEEN